MTKSKDSIKEYKTDGNPKYDEYAKRQYRYWEALKQEFDRFKSELGSTNTELSDCLGISRQPLVSFMQDSRRGLPIDRFHLLRLWDRLTDPVQYEGKTLSEQAKTNRKKLREEEGPDCLLIAAGFLPESQIVEVESNRALHIQRIVSKLRETWIPNLTDFYKLTDLIQNQILYALRSIGNERNNKDNSQGSKYNAEEANKWLTTHTTTSDKSIRLKFNKAIARFVRSGKKIFEEDELVELFQTLKENEEQSRSISESLKARIIACQFDNLSFSLAEFTESEIIKKQLFTYGTKAEEMLRDTSEVSELQNQFEQLEYPVEKTAEEEYDFRYPPVIKATIICKPSKPGGIKGNIGWQYSSCSSHLENMLAAVTQGMGLSSSLNLTYFSANALGVSLESLAKMSVACEEQKPGNGETYFFGTFVDRNALLGTLQAVLLSGTRWLSKRLENSAIYYEVCQKIAEIDKSLYQGIKALNSYKLQHSERNQDDLAKNYFKEKVIDAIDEVKKDFFPKDDLIRRCYETHLDECYHIARLMYIRLAHIEGDLTEAAKYLNIKNKETDPKNKNELAKIKILSAVEETIYKFFSGDVQFLSGREWRKSADIADGQKMLSESIKSDHLELNFTAYLCAAEISGNIARLNLYFCEDEEIDVLQGSIEKSIYAAHYASKIGQMERSAHWLTHASRIHSRLGNNDESIQFSEMAEAVLKKSLDPRHFYDYQDAVMSEVYLSHGERLLLIEEDYAKALRYFLRSLKGSIYMGFARLIADSLYGIARASKNLSNYSFRLEESFVEVFGNRQVNRENQEKRDNKTTENINGEIVNNLEVRKEDQGWKYNRIAGNVIDFLNELEKSADWNSISERFKEQAIKIWHDWATGGIEKSQAKHPLEDEIASYRFLCRLR